MRSLNYQHLYIYDKLQIYIYICRRQVFFVSVLFSCNAHTICIFKFNNNIRIITPIIYSIYTYTFKIQKNMFT